MNDPLDAPMTDREVDLLKIVYQRDATIEQLERENRLLEVRLRRARGDSRLLRDLLHVDALMWDALCDDTHSVRVDEVGQ